MKQWWIDDWQRKTEEIRRETCFSAATNLNMKSHGIEVEIAQVPLLILESAVAIIIVVIVVVMST
jgi:hypothetical protein